MTTTETQPTMGEQEFWAACPLAKRLVDEGIKVETDGLKVMTLEHQAVPSEIEPQPTFQTEGLPLPFTTDPESFAKVGKLVERTFLGLGEPYQGKVFGLLNYPCRLTRNMTLEDAARKPRELLHDLAQQLMAAKFFGPYVVAVNPKQGWIGRSASGVEGYADRCVLSPQMPLDRFAVVQITPDVVRAVVGMRPQLVDGKPTAVVVPQLRADYFGKTGVVDVTLS